MPDEHERTLDADELYDAERKEQREGSEEPEVEGHRMLGAERAAGPDANRAAGETEARIS